MPGVNGGGVTVCRIKRSKSLGWRRQEGDWCEDQEAAPTPHLISECKHEFVLPHERFMTLLSDFFFLCVSCIVLARQHSDTLYLLSASKRQHGL